MRLQNGFGRRYGSENGYYLTEFQFLKFAQPRDADNVTILVCGRPKFSATEREPEVFADYDAPERPKAKAASA